MIKRRTFLIYCIRKFRWDRLQSHHICRVVSHILLCNRSLPNFLIYEESLIFFFICKTKTMPGTSLHDIWNKGTVIRSSQHTFYCPIPHPGRDEVSQFPRLYSWKEWNQGSFLDWILKRNGIRAVSSPEFLEEIESGQFPQLNSGKKWNQGSFLDWVPGKNWIRAISSTEFLENNWIRAVSST